MMRIDNKNFYHYLKKLSFERKDSIFLCDEDESYTGSQCFHKVIGIANKLKDLGIRASDLVAVRTTRCIHTVMICYALLILGATTILCDAHNKVKDTLNQSDAKIEPSFIITNEDKGLDIRMKGNFIIKDADNFNIGSLEFQSKLEERKCNFSTKTNTKKPAIIVFTSGSTGKNKAVMLSEFNLINHVKNTYRSGDFKRKDKACLILPLNHVFGFGTTLLALKSQFCMFFPKTEAINYVSDCINRYQLTRVDGVPNYLNKLSNYAKDNNLTFKSLRVAYIGGSPTYKNQFREIEEQLKITLIPAYGMSECICISSCYKKDKIEIRENSVGKFLPLIDGKIMDENNNPLPADVIGEITVKAPSVAMCYYHDEKRYNQVVVDERLHTGDLGYLDKKGFLHIVGRKKDIIIRNGNNLSSVGIKNQILSIKEIVSCEVVGVENEKEGEVPACVIVLDNAICLSVNEIKEKMAGVLQKNEIPMFVKIIDDIPLLSSGKPDKIKIKEMILHEQSSYH